MIADTSQKLRIGASHIIPGATLDSLQIYSGKTPTPANTDPATIAVRNMQLLANPAAGGDQYILHGTWSVDVQGAGFSDRRLKENIQPLVDAVRVVKAAADPGAKWHPETESAGAVAQWLLRQLRPVSYNYNHRKHQTRFGFIADEMKNVLPQVIRDNIGEARLSGIVYEDLIAVLTYSLQDLGDKITSLKPRLVSIEERIERRQQWRRRNSRGGR